MSDDLIAEAIDRLNLAVMNAHSARRRVTGASSHDPVPPLDSTLSEIRRAIDLLIEHRTTAAH